jgi:deoxyribonuclease V
MKIQCLHDWKMTPGQARILQTELANRVSLSPIRRKPRLTCGLDCSISRDKTLIFASAVVFRVSDMQIVEQAGAVLPLVFPYVPGLLSFREIPVCLEAVGKLKLEPDLFLVDGQGIAHPRRLGLASHLGLCLDKPTIGCAKSRLIGTFDIPGPEKGDFSVLYDKTDRIGTVLRTRAGTNPLFVSPGHLCSFADATRLTLAHTTRYRLPEPTRLAHQEVSKLKVAYSGADWPVG